MSQLQNLYSDIESDDYEDEPRDHTLGVRLTAYVFKSKPRSSKWKRRYLVLTKDTLHWYKREECHSLFGRLKGFVAVDQIIEVTPLVDPEARKFEIKTRDGRRRWFRAETADNCNLWITALDQARTTPVVPEGQNVTQGPKDALCQLNFLEKETSRPNVVMASTCCNGNSHQKKLPERISRKGLVSWGSSFEVEVRNAFSESLALLFSTGEVAAITMEDLLESWKLCEFAKLPLEKGAVELKVSAEEADMARLSISQKRSAPTYAWRHTLKGLLGLSSTVNTNYLYALSTFFLAFAASNLLSKDFKEHCATCLLGSILALRTFIQAYTQTQQQDSVFLVQPVVLHITLVAFHSEKSALGIASSLPPIPQKFINGCFHDMVEAKRRWAITYRWRLKEKIDTILQEPQPHYHIIKKYYPHFYCGRGKSGNLVYYEKSGKVDLNSILQAGVTMDDLVRHYIFVAEYCWRIIDPSELGKSISVLDLEGLKLSFLQGDAMQFSKISSAIIQDHYPETCQVILAINAPSYFALLWKLAKPLINEVTQKKIRIVNSSETLKTMLEFIDIDQIPKEYGGTAIFGDESEDSARYQNPIELQISRYVDDIGKAECVS